MSARAAKPYTPKRTRSWDQKVVYMSILGGDVVDRRARELLRTAREHGAMFGDGCTERNGEMSIDEVSGYPDKILNRMCCRYSS